jgi:tRNA A37 methylthiotransferase MiaB
MWGRDIGAGNLVTLLEKLERIEGLRRIRLMYLHPQGVTDELIDKITSSDVVVSYFDLSLQHIAPTVLRGMGRWGGGRGPKGAARERFERMYERVRKADPLAGIRSTFIMGFPGESEADAREVESFVADADADWLGVFTYSREKGTRSHDMDDQVPDDVARERSERVSTAAEHAMERRARSLVGSQLEVLVERLDLDEQMWTGRSQREAPEIDGEIRFASNNGVRVGDYVQVRVSSNEGADLVGELVPG